MNHFKESIVNLGRVKTNSRKKVVFTFAGDLPKVRKVVSACSCTNAKVKGNTVEAIYSSGGFPKHLVGKDSYDTMKQIIVYYENGEKDILSFKAKIMKK